jgi:dTDP-4-amino-4,6-dideoxygalactose transaminase
MRVMGLHGISRDAWKRYTAEGSWYYEILAPGYKYNLTDVASAMGLVQLARSEAMLTRRTALAARYDAAFQESDAIELIRCPPDRTHAHHLYVMKLVPSALRIDRNVFIEELKKRGVGASVHFIPLHVHPYYRDTYHYRPESLPVALDLYQRSISLPLFSAMTDEQASRVVETVLSLVCQHRR